MELWIRSQDRKYLIPIHDTVSSFLEGVFYKGIILGTYKNSKRASEVLDLLQDFISGKEVTEKINDSGGDMNNVFPTMIFNMPPK